MQKYKIKLEQSGQRIDKFIFKNFNKIPKSLVYKYIRLKKIKVNNKKTTINYILKENDEVFLYINDELLENNKNNDIKINKKINIIYEDKNILIIDKEKNTSMHDGEDSLLNSSLNYLKTNTSKNNFLNFKPAFSNRLDINTSGLVIMCKNPLSLKEMNEIIKNHELQKTYLTILTKPSEFKNKTFNAYHYYDQNLQKAIIKKKTNNKVYKKIITNFNTIKNNDNFSLVEIKLITGKKHQIRAHLNFLGFYILGDNKYGNIEINKKFNISHQILIAQKIEFDLKNEYKLLNYLNKRIFLSNNNDYKKFI